MPIAKKKVAPNKGKPQFDRKPADKPAAAVGTDTVVPGPTGEKGTYEGYCVKCKEKGAKFNGEVHNTKTGGRMAKGPHDKCGTTICRILGKATA